MISVDEILKKAQHEVLQKEWKTCLITILSGIIFGFFLYILQNFFNVPKDKIEKGVTSLFIIAFLFTAFCFYKYLQALSEEDDF